jgi:xanthine dehydrogenase accessory factor
MRDILADIDRWREQGQPVALATVIETWGSAPRGVGAKMALTPGGEMVGSVSGGCVEGAVFEAGVEALKTGQACLLHFGVADETAWDVGLACGGSIEVFVAPLSPPVYAQVRSALIAERPVATVTLVRGPVNLLGRQIVLHEDGTAVGTLDSGLDDDALSSARVVLAEGRSRRLTLKPSDAAEPIEVFVDVMTPSPTLIIVGGVHIAIALAAIARTLGYRTVVVDPRRAFGSEARFPHADRLIQAWPDEALAEIGLTRSTAVVMLTHDPKLDDPALRLALPSPAFYVGALGSRTTQAKRRQRLLDAGLSEAQLDRLHGPIGLDLGGHSPEEVALAIMAEIVAVRNGLTAQSVL